MALDLQIPTNRSDAPVGMSSLVRGPNLLGACTLFDLLRLLNENTPSVIRDMDEWFQGFPADAAWNVYSDYCVGNPDKASDSFSFVITLNHDTDENFSEYISSVAPKDLKNTRQASEGLISYLNSPVAFSVTFMVERESKLLRKYITDENMIDFTSDMRGLIAQLINEPGVDITYWQRIDRALAAFSADVGHKGFNSKLARQILLTSAFASFLFVVLNRLKAPARIRWVTDRDATFERYNEVSFDIAFMFFLLVRSNDGIPAEPNKPRFEFAYPFMDGSTDYAEHVRLPDYLAGLCADLKLPGIEFSHAKFETIFGGAIINSRNNLLMEVLGSAEKITTRRIGFTA